MSAKDGLRGWTEADVAKHQARVRTATMSIGPLMALPVDPRPSQWLTTAPNASGIYEFALDPISKPRQTQQDKWKKRPAVVAYRAFADELRRQAAEMNFKLPDCGWSITFYLPMPKSWGKTRVSQMMGKPHQQKPDCDNLVKAVMDALLPDDSTVWQIGGIEKYWAISGRIIVRIKAEDAHDEKT